MKTIVFLLSILISVMLSAQSGSEEFITSGTFTVPAGVTSITIEVVGAGGSGGYNGTGGGGGGGYAKGTYAVEPLENLDVTIGLAGTDAIVGTTKVGTLIYATGGENGFSIPHPDIGGGGEGGMGSGGTELNYKGGNGGGGYYTYYGGGGGGAAGPMGDGGDGGNTPVWDGNCLTPGGDGGMSGGAPAGGGGKGAGFIDAFCIETDPAVNGSDYGGGGGGGNGNGGAPSAGANGYCKISWCAVDATITEDGETITANAAGMSYQWIDCSNNSPIEGAASQSYTPTVTGSYAVIVGDDVCSDTSNCVEITVVTIGVDDVFSNKIVVSPNPFSNFISVEHATGNEIYTLSDLTGKMIWTGKNIEQQNFSGLQNGVYFLKVDCDEQTQLLRIIKNG